MILPKISQHELELFLKMAASNEHSGGSEVAIRNWQMASMVTELNITRQLLRKYGVTDIADALLSAAADPLKLPDDA